MTEGTADQADQQGVESEIDLDKIRLFFGALAATSLLLFIEGIDAGNGVSAEEHASAITFSIAFPLAVLGLLLTHLERESFSELIRTKPFWRAITGIAGILALVLTTLQIAFIYFHLDNIYYGSDVTDLLVRGAESLSFAASRILFVIVVSGTLIIGILFLRAINKLEKTEAAHTETADSDIEDNTTASNRDHMTDTLEGGIMSEEDNSGYRDFRLLFGAFAATMLLLFVEGVDTSDGLSRGEQVVIWAFSTAFPLAVTGLFITQVKKEIKKPFWNRVLEGLVFPVSFLATMVQIIALLVHMDTVMPQNRIPFYGVFAIATLMALLLVTGMLGA